jgi:dehydrogenase/reductase SDR family member 12
MTVLDTILDTTLTGYSRIGFVLRRLSTDERFPSLVGKHVMVTGATGGIGRAAAERLAANGAVVHAVGRNRDKLADLVADTDGKIVPHPADLSDMSAVAALADDYVASGNPLHGLVNNVGVMIHDRAVTDEGFELTYATNVLGQYLLTVGLMPKLEASAPARVVMVSSGGMYSQGLTVANLESGRGEYNGTKAYARTKRAEVVLAEEWAESFVDRGVVVNAMHPGWVDTEGVRTSLPTFRAITGPVLRSPAEGADTIVWLMGSDAAADITGAFWHDRIQRPTYRIEATREQPSKRRRFMRKLADDAAPYLTSATAPPSPL